MQCIKSMNIFFCTQKKKNLTMKEEKLCKVKVMCGILCELLMWQIMKTTSKSYHMKFFFCGRSRIRENVSFLKNEKPLRVKNDRLKTIQNFPFIKK